MKKTVEVSPQFFHLRTPNEYQEKWQVTVGYKAKVGDISFDEPHYFESLKAALEFITSEAEDENL